MEELKKQIKAEEIAIRNILKEWDPIPNSPPDEYDDLVHQLISARHRGADIAELATLISDTLSFLNPPGNKVESIAKKVSRLK